MLIEWLLVAHIAVLGYWLGSEFVINSTYRYVCFRGDMPFAERDRLLQHVMDVDQHVRYALVLQAGLGTALAALLGLVPGGEATAMGAGVVAALWLVFVEVIHRVRHGGGGRALAAVDRGSRYVLIAVLAAFGLGLIGAGWSLPFWLQLKLGLFAGVMSCGVGIRFALIGHFRAWATMARDGVTEHDNAVVRQAYWRGTSVLILLWVFIAAMVVVSILKPA